MLQGVLRADSWSGWGERQGSGSLSPPTWHLVPPGVRLPAWSPHADTRASWQLAWLGGPLTFWHGTPPSGWSVNFHPCESPTKRLLKVLPGKYKSCKVFVTVQSGPRVASVYWAYANKQKTCFPALTCSLHRCAQVQWENWQDFLHKRCISNLIGPINEQKHCQKSLMKILKPISL